MLNEVQIEGLVARDSWTYVETVASLLGHSSLNTTRIYTTPGERDLEDAVEHLGGRLVKL